MFNLLCRRARNTTSTTQQHETPCSDTPQKPAVWTPYSSEPLLYDMNPCFTTWSPALKHKPLLYDMNPFHMKPCRTWPLIYDLNPCFTTWTPAGHEPLLYDIRFCMSYVVKTHTSCAFGPTVQIDLAFSVADNTFLKQGARVDRIKTAPWVVFGFVRTPDTAMLEFLSFLITNCTLKSIFCSI